MIAVLDPQGLVLGHAEDVEAGPHAVADAPSAPWVTAYFDRRVDEMGHGREPLGGRVALRLGRPSANRTGSSR